MCIVCYPHLYAAKRKDRNGVGPRMNSDERWIAQTRTTNPVRATSHAMFDSMATTTNPFQDSLRFERQVPACVIVIFGANGDLTKRKLLPALYRLAFDRRLAGFAIV